MWSKAAAALAIALLAGACARSAAPLPSDYGSVNAPELRASSFTAADRKLTCEEIAAERAELGRQNEAAEAAIKSDRQRNQVAGYLAALFVVPIVAVDTNDEQVALLTRNDRRRDELLRLAKFSKC